MSGGQVKNSMLVYFSLTRTSYLVTGQVRILMYLPGGQVKFFRFFYPWKDIFDKTTDMNVAINYQHKYANVSKHLFH